MRHKPEFSGIPESGTINLKTKRGLVQWSGQINEVFEPDTFDRHSARGRH